MAEPWRNWLHYGPELRDDGKRIELLAEDGHILQGTLYLDDWGTDADGDEYPIFMVKLEDESQVCPWEYNGWRFVSDKRTGDTV
jgi:hypothetical protein